MKDSEQEGQSDDLLGYYERLVRVFTAFVKYDVWYLLGKLSIYQYPNTVVGKSRRNCRLL
jgi:hypothetical protein